MLPGRPVASVLVTPDEMRHPPGPDIVPPAQLMLEAANWAPTHGKTEPWRFVVLDRAAALDLVDKSVEVIVFVAFTFAVWQ